MTDVTLLTPSRLPARNATKGEMIVRLDKNNFTLSNVLAQDMGLNLGDKVQLCKANDVFYIFKATTEDGFVLRGKKENLQFSMSVLTRMILEQYSVWLLIEEGKFPSFKLQVTKQPNLPFMVAGVDTYWRIEPPKKFETKDDAQLDGRIVLKNLNK